MTRALALDTASFFSFVERLRKLSNSALMRRNLSCGRDRGQGLECVAP